MWKASPRFFRHHESSSDITSLLLLVGHRKESLLVSEKVDKGATSEEKAEEKAVEKKLNDFESTDADRITCKGTHYLMGA